MRMSDQFFSIKIDIEENIDNILRALKNEVDDYLTDDSDENSSNNPVCSYKELNSDYEILKLFN